MARAFRFSIACKLYAIFALLATATVALALVAVVSARRHAALTDEFEAALQGAQNVERINGLLYAVTMESRSVALSPDTGRVREHANSVMRFNEQMLKLVNGWEHAVRPEHAARFSPVAARLRKFYNFYRGLAQIGSEAGPDAARQWAEAADSSVGPDLNAALDALRALYAVQARETYGRIDDGIALTAWLMSTFGAAAIMLATFGALITHRAIARPLAEITRVTEAVAEGCSAITIPYESRRDKIGALSRSISVFKRAMQHNQELNRTVTHEAELCGARREHLSAEITAFTRSIERNIAELGAISNRMLDSAMQLSGAADHAARRTGGGHRGIGRSFGERARHCLGHRRACRVSHGDRPPGGAVKRHRGKGGRRGRTHQFRGAGAERGGQAHRRRGAADH
jgi:methyl-accepting chemotaxis protein